MLVIVLVIDQLPWTIEHEYDYEPDYEHDYEHEHELLLVTIRPAIPSRDSLTL